MFKGLLCVIGASVIFGITPSIAKQLLNNGLSPIVLIFWYSAISALLNAATARLEHRSLRATPARNNAALGGRPHLRGDVPAAQFILQLHPCRRGPLPYTSSTRRSPPWPWRCSLVSASQGRAHWQCFFSPGRHVLRRWHQSLRLPGRLCTGAGFCRYLCGYLMAMGRLHFDGLHSAGRLFWSNLCVAVVMGGLLLFQRQGRACPGLEGRRRHCAELHTHVRRPTGCFCMASATWARPRRRSHPWLNPLPASSSASCFIPKTKITLVNLLGVGAHTLRHAPGHCTAQASACW